MYKADKVTFNTDYRTQFDFIFNGDVVSVKPAKLRVLSFIFQCPSMHACHISISVSWCGILCRQLNRTVFKVIQTIVGKSPFAKSHRYYSALNYIYIFSIIKIYTHEHFYVDFTFANDR